MKKEFSIIIDTTSESTIRESLFNIANKLIINKAIKINEKIYSLIDIEVYFWHNKHPDDYANSVDHHKNAGELEAHRYGIDISLGNKKNIEVGGILLRGLLDNQTNEVIQKSGVFRALFNSLKSEDNTIHIIDHKNTWSKTFSSKRISLGKADNLNKEKYSDAPYRFIAREPSLFKNFKGKEKMLKDSNLNDKEIKELLGYNLQR